MRRSSTTKLIKAKEAEGEIGKWRRYRCAPCHSGPAGAARTPSLALEKALGRLWPKRCLACVVQSRVNIRNAATNSERGLEQAMHVQVSIAKRDVVVLTYACLQTLDAGPPKEERKKPPGEIIRYSQEFLMKFSEVGCKQHIVVEFPRCLTTNLSCWAPC